ncbi:MAG: hypothetical protein J6Y22_07800, partial [Paludibacteraceae bacterium]|nr:hypothetical protein [Paludibacteraceae bacterium]
VHLITANVLIYWWMAFGMSMKGFVGKILKDRFVTCATMGSNNRTELSLKIAGSLIVKCENRWLNV